MFGVKDTECRRTYAVVNAGKHFEDMSMLNVKSGLAINLWWRGGRAPTGNPGIPSDPLGPGGPMFPCNNRNQRGPVFNLAETIMK